MSTAIQTSRAARLQIVREHLAAECQHNLDAIMATFSAQPGFALNGTEVSGYEVVRGLYDDFGFGRQGSFADIQLEVQQQYAGDDSITVELLLRAKHAGEWQGIAATGRAIEVPLCAIFTFDAADKIASERVYFDAATVLQQIGVLG